MSADLTKQGLILKLVMVKSKRAAAETKRRIKISPPDSLKNTANPEIKIRKYLQSKV
jgi:hypothetical protein